MQEVPSIKHVYKYLQTMQLNLESVKTNTKISKHASPYIKDTFTHAYLIIQFHHWVTAYVNSDGMF